MAKLYFRYGAMGSAKTLNLLAVAHNYRRQGKQVIVAKPAVDVRSGSRVASRAGLSQEADLIFRDDEQLLRDRFSGVSCLLVDEAQFLHPRVVDQLRDLTSHFPVICYGLRTDFRTRLFPGSQRLLELADSIEEVKTTCYHCNRKATFTLRFVDYQAVFDGEAIAIGDAEYQPVCWTHYNETRCGLL